MREGHSPPSFSIAFKKSERTVLDRLLGLHWINMILLEKPSMQPWTIELQRENGARPGATANWAKIHDTFFVGPTFPIYEVRFQD